MDPMSLLPFADRREAGRALARAVIDRGLPAPHVVLALPRGGVPVAAQVARAMHAPLDLLLVRKIGAPWQPEFAIGAVVEGDPPEVVVDEAVRAAVGARRDWIDGQAAEALREIARRREVYLGGRAPVPVRGATVVLVDDGIATGATVRAALKALRRRGPARVVLAVPVAPSDTLASLRADVDDIVCLAQPSPFDAVGCHYVDFGQVGDAEVVASLAEAAVASRPAPDPAS
jgi:putative phosphoribosyl transferase